MYRIAIVDDNPWDRNGIYSMLDWTNLGIEVIGTYANGQEVLDDLESINPHIILTDISMPVVNGIELAKIIKDMGKEISIIFMSCYNEFDFAKSAIDLNIYGYILKPLNPEELKRVINRVLKSFAREKELMEERNEMMKFITESLPVLQEQFLKDLLFGVYSDELDIKNRFRFMKIDLLHIDSIKVITILLNDYDKSIGTIAVDDKFLTFYSIKKITFSFNTDALKIYPVQTSASTISLLIIGYNFNFDKDSDFLDNIIEIKNEITEKTKLNTTFGVSNTSISMMDIPKLYRQSMEAINTKFYSYGSQLIYFKEIDLIKNKPFENRYNLQELFKELKEIVITKNDREIQVFLNKYLEEDAAVKTDNYIKGLTFSIVNFMEIILMDFNISFSSVFNGEHLIWQKLNEFETLSDLKQWLFNTIKKVKDYLNNVNLSQNKIIVKKIKEIINKRFNEQLCINDIAEAIYFSPLHANNIFKKETGKTIFDYLTEYRIERAKELLRDNKSKIYQICEQVGYANKSHFALQFKKYTGMSPAEYKNKSIL